MIKAWKFLTFIYKCHFTSEKWALEFPILRSARKLGADLEFKINFEKICKQNLLDHIPSSWTYVKAVELCQQGKNLAYLVCKMLRKYNKYIE